MLIPCSSVSNVNVEPVNAGRVVNKIKPKKIIEAESTACMTKKIICGNAYISGGIEVN